MIGSSLKSIQSLAIVPISSRKYFKTRIDLTNSNQKKNIGARYTLHIMYQQITWLCVRPCECYTWPQRLNEKNWLISWLNNYLHHTARVTAKTVQVWYSLSPSSTRRLEDLLRLCNGRKWKRRRRPLFHQFNLLPGYIEHTFIHVRLLKTFFLHITYNQDRLFAQSKSPVWAIDLQHPPFEGFHQLKALVFQLNGKQILCTIKCSN